MQKSHDPKILQLNLKYALFKDVICTEKLKKKIKKEIKKSQNLLADRFLMSGYQ